MNRSKKSGFTLVELVIVIAVIAILSSILIVTFSGVYENAQNTKVLQETRTKFDEAYLDYLAENNANPVAISVSNGTVTFYGEKTDANVALTDGAEIELAEAQDGKVVVLTWTADGYTVELTEKE